VSGINTQRNILKIWVRSSLLNSISLLPPRSCVFAHESNINIVSIPESSLLMSLMSVNHYTRVSSRIIEMIIVQEQRIMVHTLKWHCVTWRQGWDSVRFSRGTFKAQPSCLFVYLLIVNLSRSSRHSSVKDLRNGVTLSCRTMSWSNRHLSTIQWNWRHNRELMQSMFRQRISNYFVYTLLDV